MKSAEQRNRELVEKLTKIAQDEKREAVRHLDEDTLRSVLNEIGTNVNCEQTALKPAI